MKDVQKFQQMYRDGRMDRREFLTAMAPWASRPPSPEVF